MQSDFAQLSSHNTNTLTEVYTLVFKGGGLVSEQPLRRAASLLCEIADNVRPTITKPGFANDRPPMPWETLVEDPLANPKDGKRPKYAFRLNNLWPAKAEHVVNALRDPLSPLYRLDAALSLFSDHESTPAVVRKDYEGFLAFAHARLRLILETENALLARLIEAGNLCQAGSLRPPSRAPTWCATRRARSPATSTRA